MGAATRIVPLASGAGFIALGAPLDSTNGSTIFSFTPTSTGNCASGSYAALNGSGVDVSGYGSNLAVLAPTGAIYSTNGVAGGGGGSSGALAITGFDNNAPTALSVLNISTTGLTGSTPVSVSFTAPGYSVVVQSMSVAPDGTIAVAVPLRIDPTTGQTAAITVNVAITQGSSSASAPAQLAIQDIPQLPAYGTALGQISRTFNNYLAMQLGRSVGNLNAVTLSPHVSVNTYSASTNASSMLVSTIKARNDIDRVMTNNSLSIPAGTVNNVAVAYDQTVLKLQDRILGWYLVSMAAATNSGSGTLSVRRPYGFTRRVPQTSTAQIAQTLEQIATYNGVIQSGYDIKSAIATQGGLNGAPGSGLTWKTGLAVIGGLSAGAAVLVPAGLVTAGFAATLAVTVAAASIWTHVYDINTDLDTIEQAAQKGTPPSEVLKAQQDISNQQIGALLDGAGAAFSALAAPAAASGQLISALANQTGSVAIQAGAAVTSAIQAVKSGSADADMQTVNGATNQIAVAVQNSQGLYYIDVRGTANIANSNGASSFLTGLTGVQIDENTPNILVSQAVADPKGNYDILVPVGNSSISYGNLRVQTFDPVTFTGLGYVPLDLSALNLNPTNSPFQAPTVTGSCNDYDASYPDGDDPDCD